MPLRPAATGRRAFQWPCGRFRRCGQEALIGKGAAKALDLGPFKLAGDATVTLNDDGTATLEREGVSAFSASFQDAVESLGKKSRELTS